MPKTPEVELWELWYPDAGATGLPFARGRVDAGVAVLLVHAAPPSLTVSVRDSAGHTVAEGTDMRATSDTPIARLTRRGGQLVREDIWPGDDALGKLVILPGGEVGTLVQWWHAGDRSEWRWRIELYNHR